jgi:hypothetical protein
MAPCHAYACTTESAVMGGGGGRRGRGDLEETDGVVERGCDCDFPRGIRGSGGIPFHYPPPSPLRPPRRSAGIDDLSNHGTTPIDLTDFPSLDRSS